MWNNVTGSNNTSIGYNANTSSSALSNATAIGANASVNASNKVRLGDATTTVIEGQVAYSFPSDGRFKYDINDKDVKGLDFINRLRPVVYNFDARKFEEFLTKDMPAEIRKSHFEGRDFSAASAVRQSGFIAQEVEQAMKESGYNFNGVHVPANASDNYSVAYSQFVVPLVKSVQELSKMVEDLKKQNELLQKQMEVLQKK